MAIDVGASDIGLETQGGAREGASFSTVTTRAINTAADPDDVSSVVQYAVPKRAFLVDINGFEFNWFMLVTLIALILVYVMLYKTRFGLRLMACGEHPQAADSVGINVKRTKYLHICLGCGIMGIGGYYMGLNMSGSFNSSCWINGYGWIAVALVIFANWSPVMAILGTFVFGFFNTLQVSGSTLAAAFPKALGWLAVIPTQVYQALPFVITAIVLVGSSVRNRRGSGLPASLGVNYFREER